MSNLKKVSEELAQILQDGGRQPSHRNYAFFKELENYLQQSAKRAKDEYYADLSPAENIQIYLADDLEWSEQDAEYFLIEFSN